MKVSKEFAATEFHIVRDGPPKRCNMSTKIHGITPLKTVVLIFEMCHHCRQKWNNRLDKKKNPINKTFIVVSVWPGH
jgi:hypothetical protein